LVEDFEMEALAARQARALAEALVPAAG
jgi:hypothetical protein